MILANHGTLNGNPILNTVNNITRITSSFGTFTANNPFKIKQEYLATADRKPKYIDSLYSRYKAHSGKQRLHPKGKIILSKLIANIQLANMHDQEIIFSRSTANGNALLISLIDFLAGIGLINLFIGKQNEYDKNSSWFVPSDEFELEAVRLKIRVQLAKGSIFLRIRDKEKNELTIPNETARDRRLISKLSVPVFAFNEFWLNHTVTLNGKHLIPFCIRSFTNNLALGGRLYGSGRSPMYVSKLDRPDIKINGFPTAEPDFKSQHPAMLYALAGYDIFSLMDDAYNDVDGYDSGVDGHDRGLIKLLTLIFINAKESDFKKSVTKSGNPEHKEKYKRIIKRKPFKKYMTESQKEAFSKAEKFCEGFIEGIPDGTCGNDVYQALAKKHEKIMHLVERPNIGLELQRLDSDIMADCLHKLVNQNIPALPVHDSIICKASDEQLVKEVMSWAYQKHMGFVPRIDS